MTKLVVLDRDGVINENSGEYIKHPEEWVPIPGSLEAISRLNQSGYRVVVATNQSGIGRNLFNIETLNRIHAHMLNSLATLGGNIEAIFFCPHTPRDKCLCRKPLPGMLLEIASRLRLHLSQTPMVGDSESDLLAAQRAGAQPHLVLTGQGKTTQAQGTLPKDTVVHASLADFADHVLSEKSFGHQ